MIDWTAVLSFDHIERSAEVAIAIGEQFDATLDASVAFTHWGWADVTVHISDASPFGALDAARTAVAAVIDREPIAVELVTDAELARRADDPNWFPGLRG